MSARVARRQGLALVCLAAGLCTCGSAAALSVTSSTPLPEQVANVDIAGNSTVIGITPQMSIVIDPSDNIIGRTTGFAIRITLSGTVTFATTPAVTAGAQLPSGWTVANGGGGAGQNYLILTFTPSSGAGAITFGDIADIAGGNTELNASSGHALTGLAALQSLGQSVSEKFQAYDPVSTMAILNPVTQTVLVSGNPVVQNCLIQFYANPNERIDVGTNAQHPSRTYFSSTGAIGVLDTNLFNAGAINYAVAPGFGYFQYNPTDQFSTTMQGAFNAFNQTGASATLHDSPSCGSAPSTVPGVFSNGNATLTFTYTASQMFPINGGSSSAPSLYSNFCFTVPTNNQIAIDATAVVPQTTFTRNGITDNVASCAMEPMQYNAPVVKVFTFNPAGNTTQQSFLRISDTGTSGGEVLITGVDDAGHAGAGTVSFNLNAGQSIQLTADDLQNGNTAMGLTGALGTGTGKWRLTITSYFPNLVVTSLNRNNASGTVTNLTRASIGQ